MSETHGDLCYPWIKESGGDMYKIGELKASIAGDSRYTDVLEVVYAPESNEVFVTAKSSSPDGGRDTQGSSLHWMEIVNRKCEAHPKCIVKVIKDIINQRSLNLNFKKYGKATKNFNWYMDRDSLFGLNASNAEKALEIVMEIASSNDF